MGMSKQGEFMIYCAGQYKLAKRPTGKQLSGLFSKYQVRRKLYRNDVDLCIEACKPATAWLP